MGKRLPGASTQELIPAQRWEQAARCIEEADALLIGAGAGMGGGFRDAGLSQPWGFVACQGAAGLVWGEESLSEAAGSLCLHFQRR